MRGGSVSVRLPLPLAWMCEIATASGVGTLSVGPSSVAGVPALSRRRFGFLRLERVVPESLSEHSTKLSLARICVECTEAPCKTHSAVEHLSRIFRFAGQG